MILIRCPFSGRFPPRSPAAQRITLSEESFTLNIGRFLTLRAAVEPAGANRHVVWSSEDKSVAHVSASGVVTAKAPGCCQIVCTTADGSGVGAVCTVTVQRPVTSISLPKGQITLAEGASVLLNPVIYPSDASVTDLYWESADESVASVDNLGNVTGISDGFFR